MATISHEIKARKRRGDRFSKKVVFNSESKVVSKGTRSKRKKKLSVEFHYDGDIYVDEVKVLTKKETQALFKFIVDHIYG